MDRHFSMGKQVTYGDSDKPGIELHISVNVHPDASPTLCKQVFTSIGELIANSLDPEAAMEIAREMMEHVEKKQRALQAEADAAAKNLLGDTDASS